MISKNLIALIYDAASIQRWNDHIRPQTGFTELDKQAHKMFYAYVLAKCEGEGNYSPARLVEGGIFEFLHRIILTDIKPPIYHKLMAEKGEQLDCWVLAQLYDMTKDLSGGFYDSMERYFTDDAYSEKEKRILKAAHFLATNWEFEIIYSMNKVTYGIEQVREETVAGLAACDTFAGFRYFMGAQYLRDFLSLIGKLRYQQRWSKAARIPKTFVMGHMLVVAILSYLCTQEIEGSPKRAVNNFFGGLFHDLPEVLTRDIVSPVKASVEGLDEIIREIEREQMESVIYPLLPPEWHDEIDYFTKDEFASKIRREGKTVITTSDEINSRFNDDAFDPIDGEIIRGCDHLSAYLEAFMSLKFGVRSEQMENGYAQLREKYDGKVIGGVDFGKLFAYFELDEH